MLCRVCGQLVLVLGGRGQFDGVDWGRREIFQRQGRLPAVVADEGEGQMLLESVVDGVVGELAAYWPQVALRRRLPIG